MRKMYLFSNKTEKNRKKPVETEERELTKRAERLKVNCGTVLRTRMNTGDKGYQGGGGTAKGCRPGASLRSGKVVSKLFF